MLRSPKAPAGLDRKIGRAEHPADEGGVAEVTERITRRLFEPVQAHKALMSLWPQIKAETMAGHRLVLELRPETRSLAENAMLHALLGEIAKTVPWAGKKRDGETWKRLLTASWLRARGQSVEVLPALDGFGVDIVYVPTHTLTKAEAADLIEFVLCWSAEHGVGQVDQETGEIVA
jgi:hypothetical protein